MSKLRHIFGIFNYGCTWLGLFRIAICVGCAYGIYGLYHSDEAVFLKLAGILVMCFAVYGCLYSGIKNIKDGYNHLKNRDAERILYRESNSYYNDKE